MVYVLRPIVSQLQKHESPAPSHKNSSYLKDNTRVIHRVYHTGRLVENMTDDCESIVGIYYVHHSLLCHVKCRDLYFAIIVVLYTTAPGGIRRRRRGCRRLLASVRLLLILCEARSKRTASRRAGRTAG